MSSPALTVINSVSEEGTSPKMSSSEYSVLNWRSHPNIQFVPHPKPEALQDTGISISTVDSKQTDFTGLLDPVLSDTRRKKLDMVNRTQRDIDLPSIVVIGSQSAGKSSLIESISGISLPRSSGTCTRCPTECRLVRTTGSEPWQCTVSLRFLTDGRGRSLDAVKNITFGDPINDPKDVEERLRRAQLAILNPSIPPQVILDGGRQLTSNSLNFSSNIVCVEIRGPNMTDLSFCDLPGLIASVVDGGRDEDVDEVRDLVASYIQKPSCIILLAVACEVDFETQGAYRLAKKYDPEGVRTMGVLTKPDRIPEGEHSRWLKLIRNESSALQNGWFCVRQLSSVELVKALPLEQSRRLCEDFFKKKPWNILDALCQKRLGIKAVTVKLNEFLMSVISKRIPEIIEELQDLVEKTKRQLHALPAPPSSDPFLGVMHLINEFCDTLYSHSKGFHVDGDYDNEKLASLLGNHFEGIREAQKKFRMAVHETAPKFKPYARNAQLKKADDHAKNPQSSPSDESKVEAEVMYLDDVSTIATRAVTRELPGFSPFRVVQDLITCFTEKWRVPAFNLINDTCRIINEHETQIVRHHFEKYTAGGLYHAVKSLVNGYTRIRKELLEKQLNWLLKLESSAFTLNDSLLLKHESDSLGEHEKTRRAYTNVDDDSTALTVITTVEGYFQVAHKRFVDNVPLAIDHDLVRIEKTALREVICKGLKLNGPNAFENCAKFLAESTQVSHLRADLQGGLERLEAAQTELLDI